MDYQAQINATLSDAYRSLLAKVQEDATFVSLLDRYTARNAKWATREFGQSEKPLSEKAQKVQDFISEHGFAGCQDEVAGLISIFLDEKIVLPEMDGISYAKGVVVFNLTDEDYPLNEPLICCNESDDFLRPQDGREGSSLTNDRSRVRPATREEIALALVKQLQFYSVEELEELIEDEIKDVEDED